MNAFVTIPPELVEVIAQRAADIAEEREGNRAKLLDDQALLTPQEAADILRCKKQRVYELHHSGRLPGMKEGGRLLFRRGDLRRVLRPA